MKHTRFYIMIALLAFVLSACGGAGGVGEDNSSISEGGLAPIVNAGGDNCSDENGCGPVLNVCPQNNERVLGLEITNIRNDHGLSGDPYDLTNGQDIYSGNHHNPYPQGTPFEALTEVDLTVTRPSEDVVLNGSPGISQIHIVYYEDWVAYHNGTLSPLPKISTLGLTGSAIIETGDTLAQFIDDGSFFGFAGFFDTDSPVANNNWLDQKIILQVCETTVDTPEGQKTVSSNPLVVTIKRGSI